LEGEVDFERWWYSTRSKEKEPINKQDTRALGGILNKMFNKNINDQYEDTLYINISGKPRPNWTLTKIQEHDPKLNLCSKRIYDPSEFINNEKLKDINQNLHFKYLTVKYGNIYNTNLGTGTSGYAKLIHFVKGENFNQKGLLPESCGENYLKNTFEENFPQKNERKTPLQIQQPPNLIPQPQPPNLIPPPPQPQPQVPHVPHVPRLPPIYNTGYNQPSYDNRSFNNERKINEYQKNLQNTSTPQNYQRPPLKNQAKISYNQYVNNKVKKKSEQMAQKKETRFENNRK
jgi:hypothetical protein